MTKATTPALYLLRHGETPYNTNKPGDPEQIRGWDDVPLNKEGLQEAKDMAGEISQMFPSTRTRPAQIFSSDLKRALDTARIATASIGAPVIPTTALRPWNLGSFQGKPTEKWLKVENHYVFDRPSEKVPDGESLVDFTRRYLPFLDYLLDQVEATGQSQLAFTHYRNLKAAEAWIAGNRLSFDLPTFMKYEGTDTAEIHRIYRKGRNWTYQVINNQSGEGE